jgi:hypothetical protein
MADELQPEEGQGPDTTPGIFDSYLSAVPDDARDAVAGYLKDAEKNVNEKLQNAAALEKTWGPYEDVKDSLSQYDPEQLSELIAWHQQVTASEEAFQAWLSQAAKEAGITPQEEEQLEAAEATGELSREDIQKLIQETAEQRLGPVQEEVKSLREEKEVEVETHSINMVMADLEKEHGKELTKDQRAMIIALGMPPEGEGPPMGDASWVKDGFNLWQQSGVEWQRAFVEDKLDQPQGALKSGGTPALRPITDWTEANDALRERLRANNQ